MASMASNGPGESGWFPATDHVPSIRELAAGRGPRRWFIAAGISGLILLLSSGWGAAAGERNPWVNALLWVHMLVFVAVFMVGPPMGWYRSQRFKAFLALGFFGISVAFFAYPDAAVGTTWLWTFVSVFVGSQGHPRTLALAAIIALSGGSFAINAAAGAEPANAFSQAATIGSLGLMMMAFSRQLATIRELRQTQHELAALAVREERSRVARDMHDILGHSLTVIAVKAELAGRLLPTAPDKAAAEIADLEDLARGALEDVRATVGGYRGVNVLTELASARTALAAAGIEAELPGAADSVPATSRELFGWALREGITNVIRHAGASCCRVTLSARFLQIDDDGAGPSAEPGTLGAAPAGDGRVAGDGRPAGSGLNGLAERAAAAGATLELGRSALGGFRLRLSL
ncbi:two-component system sensor histidine kinase DesK [Arthrobacter silviterrae]|uniref:Sensor histidine kinase n=1 Tax=Arthrobacter silviterrae TaxID=2026658 RepID=A0ABX0DCW6_9MICC|nr:histidine kinase [Arthrobacter silviterrae]MDQ0279499.1 two-component system sensor histidine kinase DesK [Arthrobacter silviterrae]NGN82022.1 sensor histidine kinase [Arthrobacter silviterrae]